MSFGRSPAGNGYSRASACTVVWYAEGVTARLCALVLLLAAPAAAQDAVPTKRLAESVRAEVRAITADPTVRAVISSRPVRCSARVYRSLLAHLPVASRWLRALGMGDYGITDLPAEGAFFIDDKLGAKAACERALDEEGTLVVVARGTIDVAVLPQIRGVGVILIRYTPAADEPGILDCRATVDFRLDNGLLRFLSRPFKRTLDGVLTEKLDALVRSATALGEAIDADPVRVYDKLGAAGASKADLETFRKRYLAL